VRRGLFIFGNDGDFVYSISMGGVLVSDMADLKTPVASVEFPYPNYSDHRGYYGTTSGGVRPATMTTAPVSGGGAVPVSTTPAVMPPPAPTPTPQG
jgi:hypothetical protein